MTKSTIKKASGIILALVVGCALAGAARAEDAATGAVDPVAVMFAEKLRKMYPTTKFSAIKASPVPDLFEVQMGKNVAYVDITGRYYLFGHMYDMVEQRDLTEGGKGAAPAAAKPKMDFGALPTSDALISVKGKGSIKVAVFSDPDCPYCKDLEKRLKDVDDVTVYTYLMPLEGLHPDAKRKAMAIWCAKDRQKAWTDWMIRGVQPPAGECKDHPIDRTLALAEQYGIAGTPTIVLENGTVIPGLPRGDLKDAFRSGAQP